MNYGFSNLYKNVWFQGGHVITPLPAATPAKPGSAVNKFYSVQIIICISF